MSARHFIYITRITYRQNFHLRNVFYFKPGCGFRRFYSHLCFSKVFTVIFVFQKFLQSSLFFRSFYSHLCFSEVFTVIFVFQKFLQSSWFFRSFYSHLCFSEVFTVIFVFQKFLQSSLFFRSFYSHLCFSEVFTVIFVFQKFLHSSLFFRSFYSHLCFSNSNLNFKARMSVKVQWFTVYGRSCNLDLFFCKTRNEENSCNFSVMHTAVLSYKINKKQQPSNTDL